MNKIALVTGSNKGIGYAVVKELIKIGYTTILTSRDESKGKKAFEELKSFGKLDFHLLDVSKDESIQTLKTFILSKYGRLDVLINNAGINYDSWQKTENPDFNNVLETLETNLLGAWKMSVAFIPLMKDQQFGRIVNVSSGAGAISGMGGGTPAYSISKASLNVLTIKLAAEVGPHILVNVVCPGWVRTEMGGSEAPRSPEKGAETIVWAAEFPSGSPSGKFFRDKKEISY